MREILRYKIRPIAEKMALMQLVGSKIPMSKLQAVGAYAVATFLMFEDVIRNTDYTGAEKYIVGLCGGFDILERYKSHDCIIECKNLCCSMHPDTESCIHNLCHQTKRVFFRTFKVVLFATFLRAIAAIRKTNRIPVKLILYQFIRTLISLNMMPASFWFYLCTISRLGLFKEWNPNRMSIVGTMAGLTGLCFERSSVWKSLAIFMGMSLI